MQTFTEMEKNLLLARLYELNGNVTRTARSLDIGIRTLQRKLKSYGYVTQHESTHEKLKEFASKNASALYVTKSIEGE